MGSGLLCSGYGFCECGCGQRTRVATKTDRRAGQFKGEPIRFIPAHSGTFWRRPPRIAKFEGRKVAFLDCRYGIETMIEFADLKLVRRYRWARSSHGYAVASLPTGAVFLHRLLLNVPKGMQADHINGIRLDNRRSNLRICHQSDNLRNVGPKCGRKYKGTQKHTYGWSARIRHNGTREYLGHFKTEEEAAAAYDEAALRLHGQFARLNRGNK